ncbi:hypothetical protein CNR22_11050 [Sphingobacteriaceae bacterium]|nr:hypothetical protein CNR22_11050 [Sphingobacteriaceae bacterium]
MVCGILNHELWLDEAQHILIARDSNSLYQLIYNARYEGHPLLWNFILYFLTGISTDVLLVQIFHVLISSTCVFIILRFSPFKFFINILICFGYYMLYEYSVISRNYSISLLFVLLILIQLSSQKRNYLLIFILLGLLLNTHILSAFIAFMFLPVLWNDLQKQNTRTKIYGFVIFTVCIAFCAVHIIPPADHFMHAYNKDALMSLKRVWKCFDAFILGFFPIPDLSSSNFWNNSFILNHCHMLSPVLALSILLFSFPVLARNKTSFLFFYGCVILTLAFVYFTPLRVATRHCGFLAISLFAALWLTRTLKQRLLLKKDFKLLVLLEKAGKPCIAFILVLQLFSGIFYYFMDLCLPFSASKKTAHYINNSLNKNEVLAITHFASGPALSVYTNRSFFYLEPNRNGSFCEWNTNPILISDSVILERLVILLEKHKTMVLICNTEDIAGKIMTQNWQSKRIEGLSLKPIETQDNSIIKSERYFFYKVTCLKKTAD